MGSYITIGVDMDILFFPLMGLSSFCYFHDFDGPLYWATRVYESCPHYRMQIVGFEPTPPPAKGSALPA